MKRTHLASQLVIAVFALAAPEFVATPTSATVLATGNCNTTATRYKVSNLNQPTTSTDYINAGETNVAFTQGSAGCVTVLFSAEAGAISDIMYVRAMLDDITPCEPNAPYFAVATQMAVRAMHYVCPSVAPGSHLLRMQFKSNGGNNVVLRFRTTIVNYVR